MQTTPVTTEQLKSSVIAVPPLARTSELGLDRTANEQIVQFIEAGGVSTLLYGGNANLYHIGLDEYEPLLDMLGEIAGEETLVVPSAGPAYGLQMHQAKILRDSPFPTAMVLPQEGIMTEAGMMTAFRHFVEAMGRPAVLYIKRDGYISPEGAAKLIDEGLVAFVKYAIVRDDPNEDAFLQQLVSLADPRSIVSGIGEQPAIVHLTKFGLTGYTSGCVCVAPTLSQRMLGLVYQEDLAAAEAIRTRFQPLEDLRNGINPIRVLHDAVSLAGIAETGPQLPMLHNLSDSEAVAVKEAAVALLELEHAARGS